MSRPGRNSGRHGTWRQDCAAESGHLLVAGGGRGVESVRDAWVGWLAPRFGENQSAYVTGTYSDDYGYSNGLMLARNVHRDVERFVGSTGFMSLADRDYVCGVEAHRYRDILHWHGIIQGPFSEDELRYLKAMWSCERGHARVAPVLDGCLSYVTKYALKRDALNFDWRLS